MEAYLARAVVAVVARVAGSDLGPKWNGEVEVEVAGLAEVLPKRPPPPKAGLAAPPKSVLLPTELTVEKPGAAGVPK